MVLDSYGDLLNRFLARTRRRGSATGDRNDSMQGFSGTLRYSQNILFPISKKGDWHAWRR
jgi:hypothetical protein